MLFLWRSRDACGQFAGGVRFAADPDSAAALAASLADGLAQHRQHTRRRWSSPCYLWQEWPSARLYAWTACDGWQPLPGDRSEPLLAPYRQLKAPRNAADAEGMLESELAVQDLLFCRRAADLALKVFSPQ